MKVSVTESSLGEVGQVNKVSIEHLKGPKASNLIVPLISLNNIKVNSVTGVANAVVTIAEDHSDSIKDLQITVSDYDDSIWTL